MEQSDLTGNPSTDMQMRFAIRLMNKARKKSHFFDFMRNPNYAIGKALPFPETLKWLSKCITGLEPVPDLDFVDEVTPNENVVQHMTEG